MFCIPAALLCTETIVFIHWQRPNQTMSHAKHSKGSPPAANSMGWKMLLPNHPTDPESAQHPSLVYFYSWGAQLNEYMCLKMKICFTGHKKKNRVWMGFGRIMLLWNKKNCAEMKFNFTQATKRCSLPATEDWILRLFLTLFLLHFWRNE